VIDVWKNIGRRGRLLRLYQSRASEKPTSEREEERKKREAGSRKKKEESGKREVERRKREVGRRKKGNETPTPPTFKFSAKLTTGHPFRA
jgi:hypothetical protein